MFENRENERKWIASGLPPVVPDKVVEILNTYLYRTQNKTDNYDIRLRKSITTEPVGILQPKYFLTCKSSESTINRFELEEEINKNVWKTLLFLPHMYLSKIRYFYGDWTVDLISKYRIKDEIYDDIIFVVEHEMESEDEELKIPYFINSVLLEEVTGEPDFYGYNMALPTKEIS